MNFSFFEQTVKKEHKINEKKLNSTQFNSEESSFVKNISEAYTIDNHYRPNLMLDLKNEGCQHLHFSGRLGELVKQGNKSGDGAELEIKNFNEGLLESNKQNVINFEELLMENSTCTFENFYLPQSSRKHLFPNKLPIINKFKRPSKSNLTYLHRNTNNRRINISKSKIRKGQFKAFKAKE